MNLRNRIARLSDRIPDPADCPGGSVVTVRNDEPIPAVGPCKLCGVAHVRTVIRLKLVTPAGQSGGSRQ
jgi:hypothetical protein